MASYGVITVQGQRHVLFAAREEQLERVLLVAQQRR
jgi:hypothetical protein